MPFFCWSHCRPIFVFFYFIELTRFGRPNLIKPNVNSSIWSLFLTCIGMAFSKGENNRGRFIFHFLRVVWQPVMLQDLFYILSWFLATRTNWSHFQVKCTFRNEFLHLLYGLFCSRVSFLTIVPLFGLGPNLSLGRMPDFLGDARGTPKDPRSHF